MSKRYARNPGSDQVAKWKAALAAQAAQQRRQQYRPRAGLHAGMVRVPPASERPATRARRTPQPKACP